MRALCADQKIALLGAMQSLFEGSMYTFVFLWTPALSPEGEHLPHGMIFACFMVGQKFRPNLPLRAPASHCCAPRTGIRLHLSVLFGCSLAPASHCCAPVQGSYSPSCPLAGTPGSLRPTTPVRGMHAV